MGVFNLAASDKQKWQPGDMQFKISQCGFCKNNIDGSNCLAFPDKPGEFGADEEVCLERIEDEERRKRYESL
jgi:hypothetical protein